MDKFIEASDKAGGEFYLNFKKKGKVMMLNLLKFKSQADYTGFESLQPKEQISGEQAYELYTESIKEELRKRNSRILFYARSYSFLIGPEHEKWDAILLMEHESAETFIEFSKSKVYLNNLGHRTAALEDSRLLPSSEIEKHF